MNRIFFVLLVCTAALLATTAAAAAQSAPNETPNPNGTVATNPDVDGRLYIDTNAYVENWEYAGESYTVTLNADEPTTVYIMPPIDTGDSDEGSASARSVDLDGDSPRTVTVDGADSLYIITENFFDSSGNPVVKLDGPDPVIGGNWTAQDARMAAIGAFLSAVSVIGWKILKQITGITRSPERVA